MAMAAQFLLQERLEDP